MIPEIAKVYGGELKVQFLYYDEHLPGNSFEIEAFLLMLNRRGKAFSDVAGVHIAPESEMW